MTTSLDKIYDGFAETYEQNRGLFDISEILDSFYSQLTHEQGQLLDLGCGAGEPVSRYFVDRSWAVMGVDFSARMLELAAKYVPEMEGLHADIRTIDFEENQFNAIIASYSLFHIPATEHVDLFKKLHHFLVPGGKALFTYATKEYTGSDEFEGYKSFMDQNLFYSHKTPEALYADLEIIGFTIDASDYRNVGDELFLWVTVSKSKTGS